MRKLILWVFSKDKAPVQDWAGDLWVDLNDPNDEGPGFFDTGIANWSEIMSKLGLTRSPSVAFMSIRPDGRFELIDKLQHPDSKEALKAFYQKVLANPEPSTGSGSNTGGQGNKPVIISLGSSDGRGVFPGLGLLNLGINLPPMAWLILAAVGGAQTLKAKNTKLVWGGITSIFLINYINAKYSKNG
ncbi:MAG: hypothetical protein GXO85_02195 [Chlorobi bacterium]|nr:hypothetical protein [Chlorobiota bacterium]